MNIPVSTYPGLASWGLSPQAIEILNEEPGILEDLTQARILPSLPPGYIPVVVEVLFDDVPYLRSEYGVISVLRECLPDYQPRFIEYRVDNETAFFQVGGEIVVNRLEAIAEMMGRIG